MPDRPEHLKKQLISWDFTHNSLLEFTKNGVQDIKKKTSSKCFEEKPLLMSVAKEQCLKKADTYTDTSPGPTPVREDWETEDIVTFFLLKRLLV